MGFEKVIRSLKPAWKDPKVKVTQVSTGLFNYPLHRVDDGDQSCVVRLIGDYTDYFVDRRIETENLRRLGPTGLTQKLVDFVQEKRAMIFEYLPGRSLTEEDFKDPEIMKRVVRTFKAIHDSGVVLVNELSPFKRIYDWLAKSKEYGDDIIRDFPMDEIIGRVRKIEAYMSRRPYRKAPVHTDLLPGNFVISPDKTRVWVIDWEVGGYGDAALDVADFITELQGGTFNLLSQAEEETVLKIYYGDECHKMKQRVDLYRFIMRLQWALWALVQHHGGAGDYGYYGDYGQYARRNIELSVGFMNDIEKRHPELRL